jgi:prolyl 4-hydroxylase
VSGGDRHARAVAGLTRLNGFLPVEQCAAIRAELGYCHWYPSAVVGGRDGERTAARISACRVSETTCESWFTRQLARRLRAIDRRIDTLLPGFALRREPWQATRYRPGGKFKPHFDCGQWRDDPAGERERTVIIFLNTPRAGGETCFPHLGAAIRPATGLFLSWRNLTGEGERDTAMLHCSLPVLAGRKTMLVTWVRERALKRTST